MNWINRITRTQIAAIGAIIVLQLGMIASFQPMFFEQSYSSLKILRIILLVEVCIALLFFAVIKGRFITLAITIYLLLAFNLPSPLLSQVKQQRLSLPKNLNTEVRVVGDVMPGFGSVSKVTTDHQGFRVTKPIDYKQKNAERVFAIGGSTTEQIFIDDKKTWTALLENHLQTNLAREFEVINAGVSGLRAQHHYATFRYILQYSPDIVLFLIGINDWNQHIVESNLLPQEKEQHLDTKWYEKFSIVDIRYSILFKSPKVLVEALKSRVSESIVQRIEDGSYYSAQNDSLSRSIIKEFQPQNVSDDYQFWLTKIVNLCKEANVRCMFINQPVAYHNNISQSLRKRLWMTPPNQSYTLPLKDMNNISNLYNKWLLDFAHQKDIASCNLAIELPPTTDYFYDDCHYNEGGAHKVAAVVAQCILGAK